MRVGRPGARRIGRAVNVARANLTALPANDPYRSLPVPFRGLTLLTGASSRLNFAYLGPFWRAPYDLRAPERTHRGAAENAEKNETRRATEDHGERRKGLNPDR